MAASATSSRTRSRRSRSTLKTKRMSKEATAKVKKELKKLKMMHPTSAEATVVRNYIDWIIALPWYDKSEETYDLEEGRGDPRRGSLRPQEDQGAHPRVPRGAGAHEEAQGAGALLRGPARRRQDEPRARASRGRRGASSCGCRSAACATRRRSAATGARTSARCPASSSSRCKKVGHEQPGVPARRGRQDVDRLPRRPGGGAARGARPRAEPQLQRPLPRPRLRPVRRDVHHDGEHARRHPGPAPGPHGDHPAVRLHGVREAQHRGEVPRAAAAQGVRPRGGAVHDHRERASGRSSTTTRRRRACARSSARSRASAARWRGRWWPRARTSRSRSSAKDVPKYLGVPKFRVGKKEEHDEIGLTNGLSVTSNGGGELLACEVAVVPGKGKLVITGLLEKGMEESAQAAMSYVRSRADGARARDGFLPEGRRARSLPRVRPQGRAERRRDDGDEPRERAHQGAGEARPRDDGRDHAARARDAHRRAEGEAPRGAPRAGSRR